MVLLGNSVSFSYWIENCHIGVDYLPCSSGDYSFNYWPFPHYQFSRVSILLARFIIHWAPWAVNCSHPSNWRLIDSSTPGPCSRGGLSWSSEWSLVYKPLLDLLLHGLFNVSLLEEIPWETYWFPSSIVIFLRTFSLFLLIYFCKSTKISNTLQAHWYLHHSP